MEEMTTGLCPKCGHTLQIPAELERFSCMYCGERLTKRQLLTQPEEASCSEEDCAVSFDHAVSRLGWCVQNFRGYQKKILRDAFFEAFETYETGCAPVIQELNSGVRPERQTELLDRAAEAMLDELSAGWEKKNDMEDEKVVLAIFFVPMVRKLQLPVSEEFVSLLQKKWVGRYPKSPFYLGDYESISGGFRKKFLGLCFITTAVCQELGKPDDCAELTAFRAFRDGYLAAQPDGEALIREYYNIAPGIVTCINTCSDRHASYERIREQYLTPCYEDLLAGRNADCKTRYVQMVRDLDMNIRIEGLPTVREADGLAMSSRNGYLTAAERQLAPGFNRVLREVVDALHKGRHDYASLQADAAKSLESRGFRPDYVEIRRAFDLLPPEQGDTDLVVLGSAWLGKARLIDNLPLTLKNLTETS